MVKAFSIRGLAPLAARWKKDPRFVNDNKFGDAIADYRQNTLREHGKLRQDQGAGDFAAWFANHGADMEAQALGPYAKAASLTGPGRIRALPRLRGRARRVEPLARPHRRSDCRLSAPLGGELRRPAGLTAPACPAARAVAGRLRRASLLTAELPAAGGNAGVRRETGEEYEVKVLYGEDHAHHTGPEPCAADREVGGEASVGGGIGQPLSRESFLILGADEVPVSEGNTDRRNSARTARPGVVLDPGMCSSFLAREPGDLLPIRGARAAGSRREGEEP